MKAYKLSMDYKKEKLAFSELAFVEEIEDTMKMVIRQYLDLNLDFLYKEDQADGEPTLEAKETMGLSVTI